VAAGIPRLADLDISRYQATVDGWADEVRKWLTHFEPQFHENPVAWRDDIHFFQLGVMCRYVENRLGVQYKEDQRDATSVRYTDPSDLFLNGVMDTRRGTCGNMAVLHLAIGRRLGWPVSLACAGAHLFLRYDDGLVRHNVEATQAGFGGMQSPRDEDLVRKYRLPPEALSTGSDLRAVQPGELLGLFLGLRARHFRDVGDYRLAERDYLLARSRFPSNRNLYTNAMGAAVLNGMKLFHASEGGSPLGLAEWIREQYRQQRA
jgi:hypothetical protein